MTTTELHNPPRLSQVIREQLKSTALSLRIPAIVAVALLTVATMLAIGDFIRGRGGVEFAPELSMIPAFAGILLPIAIWEGERPFGTGFFWTLPVNRTRHALTKIFAGWILLMLAVTGFVLWLLILALITKGNITSDEMVRLLPASAVAPYAAIDPSSIRIIQWVPPPVLWLAPFFAATGMYAISSAFMLGLRHPFRWLIGAVAAGVLVAAVTQGFEADAVWTRFGGTLQTLLYGRYGLDGLLTARTESLKTLATLTTGKTVSVWRGLPVLSEWIAATLLWTSLGIAGLVAALMRHRERR